MTTAKRPLGSSGLEVMPLALGGNVFGWTIDESASFSILDAFVSNGFNLIDTADVYSNWKPGNHGGESETIIGKWFKRSGQRHKVILATKIGHEMSPSQKGLAGAYIIQAVEESLRRLQTDYIDLYQSHKDDPTTPQEETLEAYSQLIAAGKVRAIGASNYTASRMEEALNISRKQGLPSYISLQPLYNLYDRADFEKELEPFCLNHHVGVISYFSLASGFLTGKYRSETDLAGRPRAQRVGKYLNERGFRILAALDAVAKQISSKPASVALAWLIARPSVTAPIASATSAEQLIDLIAATTITLNKAQIQILDKASAYENLK